MKENNNFGYAFLIMNTDRAYKKDRYWWSFLNIHPKMEIFLFNSFEFNVLKEVIIQDDKNIYNKIMHDFFEKIVSMIK